MQYGIVQNRQREELRKSTRVQHFLRVTVDTAWFDYQRLCDVNIDCRRTLRIAHCSSARRLLLLYAIFRINAFSSRMSSFETNFILRHRCQVYRSLMCLLTGNWVGFIHWWSAWIFCARATHLFAKICSPLKCECLSLETYSLMLLFEVKWRKRTEGKKKFCSNPSINGIEHKFLVPLGCSRSSLLIFIDGFSFSFSSSTERKRESWSLIDQMDTSIHLWVSSLSRIWDRSMQKTFGLIRLSIPSKWRPTGRRKVFLF